mmetsp:Transcript_6040/g.8820  ORF Transcript_6040/g.8820 Transcript_6040/m.8820 type:complete len:381 (-) Transcript_6040:2344-3486(-)
MSGQFDPCMGTRNIKIREEKKEPSNALLAVFRCDSRIGIKIANESSAFECLIDPSYSNEFSGTDLIAQFFLSNELDDVSLAFDMVADSLKVVIRRRLGTGLVKMLWTGVLERSPTGIFGVFQALGNTINDYQKKFYSLNEQREKLEADLRGWKDTAGKLEGGWQTEKDALLENFFSIYKATHEELRRTKLDLQRLENRKEVISHERETVVGNKKRRTKATLDIPDDHDELIYDVDTVNRLAAGPMRNANIHKKKLVAEKPESKKLTANVETCKSMESKPSQKTYTGTPHQQNIQGPEAATITEHLVASKTWLGIKEIKEPSNQSNETKFPRKPCPRRQNDNDASKPRKRPKISALIDEKQRKQLEYCSALLGEDDSDDDW